MSKRWLVYFGCLVLAGVRSPVSAQATGDYAADLARVYGAHQRLLAIKEGCESSFPNRRAVYDKTYKEWETRHRSLLRDLEKRVTVMIRQASSDEQEYTRNLGKYEGAILQQRLEFKETFLSLGTPEVGEQCKNFPTYLKGPEADFRKKYAEELRTIAKRK